jgi:hypothetical protein
MAEADEFHPKNMYHLYALCRSRYGQSRILNFHVKLFLESYFAFQSCQRWTVTWFNHQTQFWDLLSMLIIGRSNPWSFFKKKFKNRFCQTIYQTNNCIHSVTLTAAIQRDIYSFLLPLSWRSQKEQGVLGVGWDR